MAEEIPDYFTGFTLEEVEQMLATFKGELTKVLAAYAAGGNSATRMRRDDLRLEIRGCQRALKKFDPEKYGRRHRTMTSRVSGHVPR